MTPEFTLTLDRHGGFAGVSMRAELHSADLTPEEAQQVWALVETAPLKAATDASSGRGAQRPDSFSYRLSVETPDDRHEYAFAESVIGSDLQPLVQRLERHLAF